MTTTERMSTLDIFRALIEDFGCHALITEGEAAELCRSFGVTYLPGNNLRKVISLTDIAEYLAKKL